MLKKNQLFALPQFRSLRGSTLASLIKVQQFTQLLQPFASVMRKKVLNN